MYFLYFIFYNLCVSLQSSLISDTMGGTELTQYWTIDWASKHIELINLYIPAKIID